MSSKAYIVLDGISVNGQNSSPNSTVRSFAVVQNSNHITIRNVVFRHAGDWAGVDISPYLSTERTLLRIRAEGRWQQGSPSSSHHRRQHARRRRRLFPGVRRCDPGRTPARHTFSSSATPSLTADTTWSNWTPTTACCKTTPWITASATWSQATPVTAASRRRDHSTCSQGNFADGRPAGRPGTRAAVGVRPRQFKHRQTKHLH